MSLAQYIAIWVSTSNGLGRSYKHLTESQVLIIGKVRWCIDCLRPKHQMHLTPLQGVLADEILFIVSLTLAKASVTLLIRRLFSVNMRTRSLTCDSILSMCIIWGLASILIIAVNCPLLSLMGYDGHFCASFVSSPLELSTSPGRCLADFLVTRSAAGKPLGLPMQLPR